MASGFSTANHGRREMRDLLEARARRVPRKVDDVREQAQRDLPMWRGIVPSIVQAFATLRRRYYPSPTILRTLGEDLRDAGTGDRWTGAARRMGSAEARRVQVSAKRALPAWREVIPAVARAFARLVRP